MIANRETQNIGKFLARGNLPKGTHKGEGYRFYVKSSFNMEQCANESIALTITSPPYWNAVDYDIHSENGDTEWHRNREYVQFGATYEDWLENIRNVFKEVYRVTMDGGFCAVVIGTILYKGKHFPAPYDLSRQLQECGWAFHQDIIWNKVTGGVKRAGVFIQNPRAGYYYPNIMTEYILIFKKGSAIRRGRKEVLPIDEVFTRDIANNIWHIAPVPPRMIEHPCPYPEELVRRLALLYSQEGDEILDPFLGSGQTAIVALKNNRKVVGYDTEQTYIDLTLDRLKNPCPQRKYHLIPKCKKIAV